MKPGLPVRRVVAGTTAVVLISAFAVQAVFADARDFTLINNTSTPLRELYLSPVGGSNWEDNILSEVVETGFSVDITFPDEVDVQGQLVGVAAQDGGDSAGNTLPRCLYDIKVVGSTGEVGVMYGVDLCSTSTVTFSNR